MEGRRLTEAERAGADTSRLQEAEVFGRQLNDYEREMGGTSTLAASEAAAGRGLEGRRLDEVERAGLAGEGLEGQRLRLASEEMYGGAGIDPRMGTLASREAVAGRGLEGRRLTEIERAGADASTQAGRRTDLAQAELYGESQAYGKTLGAREADAGREFESGERALDRGVTTQEGQANRRVAREELYGSANYGQDATSLASQDLDLRQELGRGELAERVTAGQAGRFQEGRRTALAQAELYGSGRGGDTLQSRLAGEEQERFGAATTLEAERYETERGDYSSEIARRDEQDRMQRQFEGLGASRAMDAARLANPNLRVSPQEQEVLDNLLGDPGIGSVSQTEITRMIDQGMVNWSPEEQQAIDSGADPRGVYNARPRS